MKLWEIGDDIRELNEALEAMEGDVSDERVGEIIDAWFKRNEENLENKLDGYGKLIRNTESSAKTRRAAAERFKEEYDRICALATTDEGLVKRLKNRLKEFFKAFPDVDRQTSLFKFWIQRNGQGSLTMMPEYEGEEGAKKLPKKYQRQITVVNSEVLIKDLKAVTAALEKAEAEEDQNQSQLSVLRAELAELSRYGAYTVGDHLRMK